MYACLPACLLRPNVASVRFALVGLLLKSVTSLRPFQLFLFCCLLLFPLPFRAVPLSVPRSDPPIDRQVSTPSLGVGYKIAIMIHQRCKPCLCLFNKNLKDAEGNPAAPAHLSPMLTGDRNIDVREEKGGVFSVLVD